MTTRRPFVVVKYLLYIFSMVTLATLIGNEKLKSIKYNSF